MNKTRNTLPPPPFVVKPFLHLTKQLQICLICFARIKQAHWNVRGTTFIGLHKLLDEFAEKVMTHIDLAAERATALGGIVEGTLRMAVKRSRLEKKEEPPSISGMSDQALADFHAEAGERVRNGIKKTTEAEDFGTADLLTDILRQLDLQLWLLEAHINQHKN
ncbi:MAG: DNA starvation/stationary phase protection protein Dps [Limisphaerales bacterium]